MLYFPCFFLLFSPKGLAVLFHFCIFFFSAGEKGNLKLKIDRAAAGAAGAALVAAGPGQNSVGK